MKKLISVVAAALLAIGATGAMAHHSIPGEFGDSSRETNMLEAKVVALRWMNPHIFVDLEITGGEVGEPGEKYRIVTHPINIITEYGFKQEDIKEGDTIHAIVWTHLRDLPLVHPRAIQVNDGPMRSLLVFADMRDIVSGELKAKNITPAPHLEDSSPGRAGKDVEEGLRALGYIGADGTVDLPDDF